MLFRLLFFVFLITVSQCLTGIQIIGAGINCTVILQQLKTISENETEWIKLPESYTVPCYDTVQKPNYGRFTVTTKIDGSVYLTFIVLEADEPKKLKIGYLDPETRKFGALKKLSDDQNCLKEDLNILPYLNFKKSGGVGKVDYGGTECIVDIKEDDFFNKDINELDNIDKNKRTKRQSSDSLLFIQNTVTVEAVNDVTNDPTTCLINEKIDCTNNPSLSNLNNSVVNPSLFFSGNITILKMSDRFNFTPADEKQKYIFMDNVGSSIETWPNFAYIFDETAFESSLFFSQNFDNSSASTFSFLHALIFALIIQVLLVFKQF